jgi:pimeloyl-ACP methyl ester carboxylesterase
MPLREESTTPPGAPHNALELLPVSAHSAAVAPRAAVLFLHGGRADGLEPPPLLNLPRARMRPFARAVAGTTAGDDVLLGTVRYRHRGWNGARGDTVRDAWEALEELTGLAGPVPVVLVGHSMGGRAALRVAGHLQVRAVVGLAPWCPPGEPVSTTAREARGVAARAPGPDHGPGRLPGARAGGACRGR